MGMSEPGATVVGGGAGGHVAFPLLFPWPWPLMETASPPTW